MRKRAGPYNKICERCNKDYLARAKDCRYCSPPCALYKKKELKTKKCKFCNKEFRSGRIDKVACGHKDCLSAMNNRRCYSWRLKAFGLTEEEYENMVKLQDGSCAICLKPETYLHKGVLQNLAIDHDHNTGKVRALLCAKCNKGIGIFNENTETMKSAIRYIEFHKESSN